MKFLHLLSTEASQDITFHCLSDPPFNPTNTYGADDPGQEYQARPPRFRGWNGQMFEADSLLEPHMLLDECRIQDGSWHQSRFFFHTQDSYELPIIDIQEQPLSQSNDLRHLEVGPVCFL
uniref:Fibrillar collagen NC1 domain-containing protein n=2 Tax=Oncorhynchus mykiss TaxID=8022 RepID=A0A8C7M5T1_ONCMY